MTLIAITLRPGQPSDVNFILDSWLDSYRNVGENEHMSNQVYFAIARPRVVALLERSTVTVACNPSDHWQIYGWTASEPGVLHYVYVKRPFRRAKVGDRLVESVGRPRVATHTGDLWPALWKAWNLSYDPRCG